MHGMYNKLYCWDFIPHKDKKGGRNNKTDTYNNHNKNKRVSIFHVYEIVCTWCFLPPSGTDTWSVHNKQSEERTIIWNKPNKYVGHITQQKHSY